MRKDWGAGNSPGQYRTFAPPASKSAIRAGPATSDRRLMQPRNDQTATTTPACGCRDDGEMFDCAPVSLWLEDYSGLKALFREWRLAGVVSLRDYLGEDIHKLVAVNNQFYPGLTLSLSIGIATSGPGERLEAVAKRADLLMFEQKRAYYAGEPTDRRRTASTAA
jgi:hypothetical protein